MEFFKIKKWVNNFYKLIISYNKIKYFLELLVNFIKQLSCIIILIILNMSVL